jgi:[ribosomal protein S18]-alanine N-acetyltransferase
MTGIQAVIEIDRMKEHDIPRVKEIEKLCFTDLWPEDSFEREITNNRVALYLVARIEGVTAGYMGTWLILDEAHITTFAVDPAFQGKKLGLSLLWNIMNESVKKGVRWATLEVNEENKAAIHLYEKFGFKIIGKRREYYGEGKNAVVMWGGNMQKSSYNEKLEQISRELSGIAINASFLNSAIDDR